MSSPLLLASSLFMAPYCHHSIFILKMGEQQFTIWKKKNNFLQLKEEKHLIPILLSSLTYHILWIYLTSTPTCSLSMRLSLLPLLPLLPWQFIRDDQNIRSNYPIITHKDHIPSLQDVNPKIYVKNTGTLVPMVQNTDAFWSGKDQRATIMVVTRSLNLCEILLCIRNATCLMMRTVL